MTEERPTTTLDAPREVGLETVASQDEGEKGDTRIASIEREEGSSERTNLHGKKGREQRKYKFIIDKQKEIKEAHALLERLRAKNYLATQGVHHEVSELIDKYSGKNP